VSNSWVLQLRRTAIQALAMSPLQSMHGAAQGRQLMPNLTDEDTEFEAVLNQLSRARIKELRERWRSTFRAEPPAAFGPDLLRRSIAHRLQEKRYGGLSASVQRQLNQVIKTLAKKRSGHIELPKRVKSGSVLVRLWKGKSHRVTVLDDGFALEGRVYNSLSEIAREITGTRWNGPKFFGLRPRKSEEAKELPRRRGRPPGSGTRMSHDR
jgi:ribosomal protein S18